MTRYRSRFLIDIEPIWQRQAPLVTIALDDHVAHHGIVPQATQIMIDKELDSGWHDLAVILGHKSDHDPVQAVKIKNIKINDITSAKFVWQARYRPDYPEPWASQQRQLGMDLPAEIGMTDYLGWNGRWNLRFSAPVFTWIHDIESLGWIYD
jgi:hypothetical protein